MSTHPIENMFAGDDWQINATLLDQNGAPYDLSGSPTIMWTLMDTQGARVIETSEVTITVTNSAQGQCSITVPHTVTTRLPNGMFIDVLRLVISNVVSTLCVGQILVYADPWSVALMSTSEQFKQTMAANQGHVLQFSKFSKEV